MRKGMASLASFIHFHCKFRALLPSVLLLIIAFAGFAARPLHSQILGKGPLSPATPSQADKAASPSPAPTPTPILAIPLAQVADQTEELDRTLREISRSLTPDPGLRAEDTEENAQTREISQRARQVEELLAGMASMMQLQDEDRYWRALEDEFARKRKLLTASAAAIEEKIRWLNAEQARWEATAEQVREATGLEIVAQRVEAELDAIHTLHSEAQEQLNKLVTRQNRISEHDREISAVLRKLGEEHERLRGRLFERDSQPLWAVRELHAYDQPISGMIHFSVIRGFAGTTNFLRLHQALLLGMAIMYVFVLLFAFRFRNYAAAEDKRDVMIDGWQVFKRPFSIALLITLLTTIGITASAPTGVSFIVCLLYLVPVLRLLPGLTQPAIRKPLYALCVFYALEWTHLAFQFRAVFKRELFALIILFAFVVFTWLARPSRLKMQSVPAWRRRMLSAGIYVGLFLLAASVIANVFGFVSLSQIFGVGVLFSVFTCALLYTLVRVLHLGILMVVSSSWFQSLPDIQGVAIERWGGRILVLAALLVWLDVNLYLFTLRSSIVASLQSTLEYPISFGKVQITLGGTLNLVLFLLLGYAVANAVSFILGKILLPKLSLRGGMAYAISRVAYYVLLGGLFFAGLVNTGFELNKFTLITGALGLGVGFGLQNIVNNFASGLIILFERPIRIGDTVEVSGVVGTVRRIGARSSTVLTFQGAEVIFPNSNLLSNQVTNWTLSSTRRRVEIPVSVSYGTDPEVVIHCLTEIATSNPHVLVHPRPETLFLGFGESALNFELRFWAAQALWFELKSQIGLLILESFRKAEIEIPYPQRDLHFRGIQSPVKEDLSAGPDTTLNRMVAKS
jgi:potassium efflux system protein